MFAKRETPPPGFIRPEEFASRAGLSVASVAGLISEQEIIRLDNREFGILDYDEQELLYPNYGARGVIPESEVEKFLLRCWSMGWEADLRPLIVRKVRDFITLPGNEELLAMVMAPRKTEDGHAEKPKKGEFQPWDLSLLYKVGEEAWTRLMKSGAIRFRYMYRGQRTARVVISGEVDRMAKECPDLLPKKLRKQLAEKGRIVPDWESYRRKEQHRQWLEEGRFDLINADFYGRVLPQIQREAAMRPAV